MRGAKRTARRDHPPRAVSLVQCRPPVFLRRCLRPSAELGRLLRGSAEAVRQCRPVDATVIQRVNICVPESAGNCVAGLVVAFSPRLSSKQSVRYTVLSTGLLQRRTPRSPDGAAHLELVKPLELRVAEGGTLGEIVVVAALCLPSTGGAQHAARAAESAAEQFAAFSKAKPPLNMQLAVRSHLKASGLGSSVLEYCVAGRYTAGDAWRAGTAPHAAVLHSRLFNALSGISRDATDAGGAEAIEGLDAKAPRAPREGSTLPAGPFVTVLLEHRSSFRDILHPPCRVLSPLQASVLKRLCAAAATVGSLHGVAASPTAVLTAAPGTGVAPPTAGDKRPREAPGVANVAAVDGSQELLVVAKLLRDALGACLLPAGRPVVSSALDRLATATRVSSSTGGEGRFRTLAALVSETQGELQVCSMMG